MRIVIVFVVLLVLAVPVSALSEDALDAQNALLGAEGDMGEMVDAGMGVTRYNDTLIAAKQLFEAQVALEGTGGEPDFSLVYEKIAELEGIKQKAFQALDELTALELAINQTEGIELSGVWALFQEARDEFESERFEECLSLVDETYRKISELEALETKIRAFYEAMGRNVMNFVVFWWKEIALSAGAIVVIVYLTHNRVSYHRLRKRLEGLEKRRESVRKLIAGVQKEYFEGGRMSEESYHIKLEKYGEIIRDINRQIPLLKEELTKRKGVVKGEIMIGKI